MWTAAASKFTVQRTTLLYPAVRAKLTHSWTSAFPKPNPRALGSTSSMRRRAVAGVSRCRDLFVDLFVRRDWDFEDKGTNWSGDSGIHRGTGAEDATALGIAEGW